MPPASSDRRRRSRPPGFMSASSGVRALIRSKSSMSSWMPASCAIASRCSTALVEPPVAATPAMAFSKACAREDVARREALAQDVHDQLAALRRRPRPCADRSAGTPAEPIGDRPQNSIAMAMVFAVNWPPQAPAPGQARSSRSFSSSSVILPAACAPTASYTSWMVRSRSPWYCAGHDRAAVEHQAGMFEPRPAPWPWPGWSCRSRRA